MVTANVAAYGAHMAAMRDRLETQLVAEFGAESVVFNGRCAGSMRLPNTSNFSLLGQGLYGSVVLAAAKGVRASVGAACHQHAVPTPSRILLACGIPVDLALNAQRWRSVPL